MSIDMKREGVKKEEAISETPTSYKPPLLSNIKRVKGNKRIADIKLEDLLPHEGSLVIDINPTLKLEVLGKLSSMSVDEICTKYRVLLTDLQKWSQLLTLCNDDNNQFIDHHRKRPRNISRETKHLLVQECYRNGNINPCNIYIYIYIYI